MPPATSPRSDAFNELSYASRLSTRSPSVRINAWRSFTNPVTQQTLDAGVDDGADLVGHHGRRAHRREAARSDPIVCFTSQSPMIASIGTDVSV